LIRWEKSEISQVNNNNFYIVPKGRPTDSSISTAPQFRSSGV